MDSANLIVSLVSPTWYFEMVKASLKVQMSHAFIKPPGLGLQFSGAQRDTDEQKLSKLVAKKYQKMQSSLLKSQNKV